MVDNQPDGQGGTPCPKCGTLVAPGDRFCLNCGTEIPALALCPACGNPLEEGAKFCQFCGVPVSGEPARAHEPEVPEPEKEAPPVIPKRVKIPEQASVPAAEERKMEPLNVPAEAKPASPGMDPLAFPARDAGTGTGPEAFPAVEGPVQKKGGRKRARKSRAPWNYVLAGILILAVIGIIGIVLLSGSPGSSLSHLISPTPEPTPTPTPTPEPTPDIVTVTEEPTTPEPTPTPTPTLSLEPEATDTLPAGTDVSISIDPVKSPSDASVTVVFNGGPGMRAISVCNVTLIRSDGEVVSGKLDTTKIGSELSLQGTRGVDRVIVYVTQWTGKTYKVIDQSIGYR